MKRFFSPLFVALLVIAATLKVSAQTEQTRQVSGFNSVSSSSSFNVHVKIDGTESLKITADDNIINEIETKVEDGTLRIGMKSSHNWFRNVGRVDVYVTAKSLSRLSNSGSGSMKLDGTLTGSEVELHISGSGNMTAAVKADNLHTHISGSGSISVSGTTRDAQLEISGSGELRAKELKAGTVKVSLSGSGSAYIHADQSLSAHISGSGSLVYSGNGSVTNISTSGSGRVRKEND